MAGNFKENKVVIKAAKVLPCVFSPLMILEIYSLGVRVLNYGLTPFRYVCIMFIIFQIVVLIFTFIKNKEIISYLFFAVAVLVFILFISPFNLEKMPKISQEHVLTKYYKEDTKLSTLNDDEKQKVVGAYDYLAENKQYLNDIPSYVKSSEVDKLRVMGDYSQGYLEEDEINKYYNYIESNIDIDVSNYSRIIRVNMQNFNNNTAKLIFINSDDVEIIVNLKEPINELITLTSDEFQRKLEENKIYKIDDEKDLYISSISITYNTSKNKVINLVIYGYVLFK